MLTALQQAKRNGAKIIAINPLPETGFCAFRATRRSSATAAPAALMGRAPQLADLYLQVRIDGDIAAAQGDHEGAARPRSRSPGRVFDRAFIDEHTDGFEALRSTSRRHQLGGHRRRAAASRASRSQRRPLMAARSGCIIACWAMGLTQHRTPSHHPGNRQPAAAARRASASRARAPARARPLQRAGRPHHGHLGAAHRQFLDALGRTSSTSRRRAKHGFDVGGHDQGHARRRGQGVRRPGRQLPLGHARYRAHRRGAAAAAASPCSRAPSSTAPPGHRASRR